MAFGLGRGRAVVSRRVHPVARYLRAQKAGDGIATHASVVARDDEWSRKSDRWVAEKCGVDGKTVARLRAELTAELPQLDDEPRKGADGKTRKLPKKPKKPKKGEIAIAFKRLRELPKEQGGTKPKRGRPKKGAASGGISKGDSRDAAASVLGVGRHEAEALETIFTTPGEEGEERQCQIPVPYHAFTRWAARKLKERR